MNNLRSCLAMAVLAAMLSTSGAAGAVPPRPDLDVALPDAWRGGCEGQFDTEMLGFGLDAQVKSLIAEALDHNADLKIAGARLEQSYAALKASRGLGAPTIGLGGQAGASAFPASSISTTGVALTASWEVDLWGKLRSDLAASSARSSASRLDVLYTREAVAAAVVRAWFGLIEADQAVALSRRMLALSEQQLQLIRTAEAVGRNAAQDVTLGETAVETYRHQLQADEQRLGQARRALEILCGRYPSTDVAAADRFPDIAAVPAGAGIPSELISRRPDVLAAEERFRAAYHDTEVAKRARLPSLTLTGGVAYIADSAVMLQSGISNPAWALSGRLLAPIFTGGRLEAQLEAKTAAQQEAVAQYNQVALNALYEVESRIASEKALAEREATLRRQVALLQTSVGYADVQQQVGKGDQSQVLARQLSLVAAEANLLHIRGERFTNRVALHQSLGGHFPT